jgi:MFS family permease
MNHDKATSSPDIVEPVESLSLQYSVFSTWRKRCIVGLIALAAWFSTLSSFIYYPAITLIAKDLQLSVAEVNLSITSYMAISAVAPSITGDASDLYGRRPLYLLTLIMYLLANIGIAVQSSFAGLLLLRMLQSAGISGKSPALRGKRSDAHGTLQEPFRLLMVLSLILQCLQKEDRMLRPCLLGESKLSAHNRPPPCL